MASASQSYQERTRQRSNSTNYMYQMNLFTIAHYQDLHSPIKKRGSYY